MAPTVRACGALVRRARARSERSGPPRVLLHSILPKSFPNLVPILISSGLLSLKRGLQIATGRVYGHYELFLFHFFPFRDRALNLPRQASLSLEVTSVVTRSFAASVAARHHHLQRTERVEPPANESEACLRARQPPPTRRCDPRGVARVTVFSAEGDDG